MDDGKYGCGIFVDFQNAFNTVDQNHTNRNEFASINGFDSDLVDIISEIAQGSILNHLLFLVCMNDRCANKYCNAYLFAGH